MRTLKIRIDSIIKTLPPSLPTPSLTHPKSCFYGISSFHMGHSSTEISCSLIMLFTLVAVAKSDHKNEDCLVVVVLTHGHGKDYLYAYDEKYKTDTLWSCFTADVCPGLAGKPKIFIIQVSVKSVRLRKVCVNHPTPKYACLFINIL